jgi:tRNA dimethylallyltransferase
MIRLAAVLGPTATGKTKYAIEIAKRTDGEIVSCDSMQLYKFMDIGSAKPTPEEMAEVPHHIVDEIDPREPFSAARYKELAEEAIEDIASRGRLPIMAGGTGLYFDSVIYDLDFASPPPADTKLRERLKKIADEQGPEALHDMLAEIDPASAARIHPHNVKRVIRALETAENGEPISDFSKDPVRSDKYETHILILERDREELYRRIDERVDELVKNGLVEEVKGLIGMGLCFDDISMKGIGYKEIIDYLEGRTTLDEAIENVKKNTRHYAKRQITWLKRYDDAYRINLTGKTDGEIISEIEEWLKRESLSTTKATNPTT